ncbi:MAG: TRAP transporter large permease subunit, partial [Ferrovibrio sp.]
MTGFQFGIAGIVLLFVMLFLRQPVWLAMAVVGVVGNIFLNNLNMAKFITSTTFFDTAGSYSLSVIPLFILMGEIASG